MTHSFHPSIIREYDIRGIVGETLSDEDAYHLGRAFGTGVKLRDGDTVAVGYDGRESSPKLTAHLMKGLQDSGCDVINVGLGPTPMLYYAVKHHKAAAGIMVTGSHNPPTHNGFKMTFYDGPVFGEAIQGLAALVEEQDYESGAGSVSEQPIHADYITRLLQDFKPGRDLKIAWDAGNGSAGAVLKDLTDKLPGTHILLYNEVDGTFPNHHPDPTVDENLVDLINVVKEQGCDFGIAFDGDGDRIGVVDEGGTVIRADILLALYAADVLKDNRGATIIGDVKCSSALEAEIRKLGGEPLMWRVGHSWIKSKMAETGALLAGELSGHIFFADRYHGYDDALYAALRLMNIVAAEDKPLSAYFEHMPKLINTPEIRFEVDEDEKFDLVPRITKSLKAKGLGPASLNDIDGIRVSTEDGWWLIRPSNTQNALSFRAESDSIAGLESLIKMAYDEVQAIGYTLPKQ